MLPANYRIPSANYMIPFCELQDTFSTLQNTLNFIWCGWQKQVIAKRQILFTFIRAIICVINRRYITWLVILYEFNKRAFGEFHKYNMKWSRMYDFVYHMTNKMFLFFLWPLKLNRFFFSNRKHNIVTECVIMLHASNQALRNVWSYHFMTWRYPLNHSYVIWLMTNKYRVWPIYEHYVYLSLCCYKNFVWIGQTEHNIHGNPFKTFIKRQHYIENNQQ